MNEKQLQHLMSRHTLASMLISFWGGFGELNDIPFSRVTTLASLLFIWTHFNESYDSTLRRQRLEQGVPVEKGTHEDSLVRNAHLVMTLAIIAWGVYSEFTEIPFSRIISLAVLLFLVDSYKPVSAKTQKVLTHGEQLACVSREDKRGIRNIHAAEALCMLIWALYGEVNDVAGSRMICLMALAYIKMSYTQCFFEAEKPLDVYNAEATFRIRAAENNISHLKKSIVEFALAAVEKQGELKQLPNTKQQIIKAADKNDLQTLATICSQLKVYTANSQNPETGNAALHVAVSNGRVQAIDFLKNVGANVNLLNKEGNSPVHLAVGLILSGKSNGYDVLFALIRGNEKNDFIFSNLRIPAINVDVKLDLKNGKDQTVMDLFQTISDKEDINYLRAKGMFEQIKTSQITRKQQLAKEEEVVQQFLKGLLQHK